MLVKHSGLFMIRKWAQARPEVSCLVGGLKSLGTCQYHLQTEVFSAWNTSLTPVGCTVQPLRNRNRECLQKQADTSSVHCSSKDNRYFRVEP
ncbi:hypothetical protein J6590_070557 [Homalodisca vitripennis]|nr:hypothetical protein J6590_070557 [Homalodisca vitripennis]